MDNMLMSNDLAEIKKHMNTLKMRQIKLVASMIHLFDWIDSDDIIYQQELRELMEEYLLRWDIKIVTGKCDCKREDIIKASENIDDTSTVTHENEE